VPAPVCTENLVGVDLMRESLKVIAQSCNRMRGRGPPGLFTVRYFCGCEGLIAHGLENVFLCCAGIIFTLGGAVPPWLRNLYGLASHDRGLVSASG